MRPSPSIAVAPQRSSLGHDRSVVFTAAGGGATIVASDAENGEELARWEAGGPVTALAYDPDAPRLLVGRADVGAVETYELAGLLASPDGRAPPSGPPVETELAGVSQIDVPRDAEVILLPRTRRGRRRRPGDGCGRRRRASGTFGGVAWVRATDEGSDFVAATDPARGAVVFLDSATLQPVLDEDGGELGILALDSPLVGPLDGARQRR